MNAIPNRYQGKTAVVTGGASGIGFAVARRLADEGANLAICDIDGDRLDAAARDLGADVLAIRADVTKEAEVEAFVAAAVDRFGGLDAGFNVAGSSRPSYIVDITEADWDFVVDLCLKGVLFAMKHQARHMLKAGRGAIVNIASVNARIPMHAGSAYTTAKAGVEMLTKNGALEFAPQGVRVNAILPGLVETPLTRPHFQDADRLAAFQARIPMGRPAQPEDIAAPALYLASDDAAYVSGAGLVVDGAWSTSGYPDMRPWRGPVDWLGG